jgi:hypothetical protein
MVIWDGSNYRIGKLWSLSTIPVPLASVICALCRSHQCQLVEKACRLTFLPSVARETCARMQGFSSMPGAPAYQTVGLQAQPRIMITIQPCT